MQAGVYTFPTLPSGDLHAFRRTAGLCQTNLSGITLQVYQKAVLDIVMKIGGSTANRHRPGKHFASRPKYRQPGNGSQRAGHSRPAIEPASGGCVGSDGSRAPSTPPDALLTSATGNGSGFNDNSYSGAGGYSGGNLLLIDGMISRSLNNGSFALNPPPEMVKEFKIQNNIYDAAFGLTSGTAMNLITQSGTNGIHGGAWEYLRNRDFDARNYFDTAAVSAQPSGIYAKPVRRRSGLSYPEEQTLLVWRLSKVCG